MSLVIRLVVAVGLVLLSAASWAQLNYYTLIDSDSDAATGCIVTLPTSGTVAGVERRLTATVSETATPQVTQLTLESCIGGSFGAPVALPGAPYPVGSNNGVGGADVIEQGVETNAIAAPGASVRLYFAAQGPTSDDLLGSPNNPPILFNILPGGGPADIPFLTGQGFLVLALLLLVVVFWQRSRLPAGMAGALLVGALAGIAWAAGFRLDGEVNDWQGVPAIGSDAGGDSAPNTDIVTAFAAQEGGNLFFRSDIANTETSPSTNQPPSFTSTPIITANIASPYNYTITTRDPDGSALALTAPTLPAWLRFVPGANGAGTLSGTPGPADLGPHAVVLRVTDNGTPSQSADQAFTVTVGGAANPAPTIDLNGPAAGIGFAATFTEGGGAVAIVDPANLTVSDPDSPNLASATATLANLLDAGQETLATNAAAPITASFNATTGVLTLAGSAPLAQYQTALRTVTYNNAAAAPTATARVITFIVSDGANASVPATATVTFASVNDAPSFTAANPPAVNEDSGPQTVNGWVTAFNPGPADESAQTALAYTVSNVSNAALFSTPPSVNASGNLSYTPAPNAFGTSTFQVRVQDSGGTANGGVDTSAPQTFTITVNGINDQPSFTASNPPAVNENAGSQTVTGWATFNSGNSQESAQTVVAYTVSTVSNTALFSVQPSVAANGNLTYTPAVGANGTSTFSVAVQDNGGTANGGVDTSATQTFTIAVNAVNDPPVANSDSATVAEGGTVTVLASTATSVLANDTDPDVADILSATTAPVSGPTSGSLTLNANGSFSYTHNGGETTSDSFVYQACDNGSPSLCANATVSITITPVNDGPTANADSATVNEGGTVTALTTPLAATSVRDNDTDPDNLLTALTATTAPVTPPANGSLTLNADGTFSYTHDGGETTTDSFVYEICDPQPLCSTATVSIIITPGNDAPAIALLGPGAIYDTTGSPVVLDATATVSDVDSPNFDTGVLAANVTTNCDANDRLGVRNEGTGPSQIGVSGANITYNPGTGAVTIGVIDTANTDFDCATPAVPTLRVALNASADLAATQALLRNLAFFSASTTPPTPQRTVEISLTDGDGGTSNTATKLVDLDAAPSVSAVAPANSATGVAIDADVVITFSENVTVTGNWFQIACPTSGARTALSGTAITGGPTAFTINPTVDFANGETCTVTVTATQVADQDTLDPPDNLAADFTSTFTTVDIAPTVLGTSTPANGVVVPTTQVVTLDFSEAVNVAPANIGFVCNAVAVPFAASGTSNVTSITLTPNSPLAAGANCTLNVPVTAATDADTVDPPDELGAAFNRIFSVDAVPTVTTTAPTNGATDVPTNSNITVNFSESVNVVNASFTIACPAAQTFVATGTGSITLDPTVDLPGGATCTVTVVAANVTDADVIDPPNNMAANVVFSFETAAVANDDAYTVTPHLTYVSPAGVRGNDNPTNITITGFGSTLGTANGTVPNGTNFITAGGAGGRVILNADGTFAFWPDAGDSSPSTATFFYTIAGGDTAQVTLTFEAEDLVWFVDNSPASTVCTGANVGTQACPAATLGAVSGVDTAGDTIFVASGNYACGITLEANERLVGDGSGSDLATLSGVTPVAGSDFAPYNTFSGTRPALTSGAACITLASNNTLRGFNLSNTGGTALVGNNFGNLVVAETSVSNSNGAAISLNTGNPTATFTSVSANGGTNGISLTSTTGSFAVTGTGGLCSAATPACTGGTISNVTDTGVKLTNASNITLTRMRVQNSPNFGLNGSTVNTMNIDTCLFDGTHGSAIDEGAIFVTNWFGSGTISNSEITGGANDNVRVTNTAGALNRLTISNTTIRDNSTVAPGNHGLRFATDVASGAGAGVVMNLTVTGSTFRNNHSNHIDTGATGQSTMDLVLDSNTFTSNATTLAGAVNITDDHQADVTFDVNSNTMNGAQLSAFNFFMSNQTTVAASMVGKFRNNIIGTSGVAGSGSAQGNGVDFTSTGLGTFTVNVTGNTVRQFAGIGIGFSGGDTSPRVNATVTGNTIKEGDAVIGLNAISFNMGSTAAGAVVACADLGGAGVLRNDVSGSVPNGTGEIRVRQRNSSTVQLPGLTGAVDAFLAGRNIVTNTAAVTFTGAFGNNGGAACTQAP